MKYGYANRRMKMSKGSGRRKHYITDAQIEEAWESIFAGHPNEDQFEQVKGKTVLTKLTVDEDDYIKRDEAIESALDDWAGKTKKQKPRDPDRFVDDSGDA